MLAAKFFDGVVGVDIHWELVPAPPAPPIPTPFPNPFVGMVFDPLGLGVGLVISNAIGLVCGDPPTGPVLVNFVPAANTGTDVKGFGHILIPPGTSWAPMPSVKPAIKPDDVTEPDNPGMPDNDGTIVTGSKTVHVMGSNWSRLGDRVMTCSEPVRLPSSVVLATPKGLPVLVGGPPALDFMAAAGALLRSRWVSDRVHALVSRLPAGRLRNLVHRAVCFLTGHPVDVATGRVFTENIDFELPGPLPLRLERVYCSGFASRSGSLGYGWSHSLDQRIWRERGKVVYLAEDGRELEFDTFEFPGHAMAPGDEVLEPIHRATLRCLGEDRWELRLADGLLRRFEPVAGGEPNVARLALVSSRDGHHRTELAYDARGCLSTIRDSSGRRVRFEHDERGRLVRVLLPVPNGEGHYEHVRYRYDERGDLVEVTDAARASWSFEYVTHLLTRETDRTGLSFYFGYDGIGEDAWCIRTWGDGGIYDHELLYDKKGRVTAVTNSLGETTLYRMNALGLVTELLDPFGHATRYEYDSKTLLRTATIDALGGTTRSDYDERGNRVSVRLADGARVTVDYDALDNPLRAIDPNGSEWLWCYDAFGSLEAQRNPLGGWTRYEWRDGLLASVELGGARTEIDYDEQGLAARIRPPDGGEVRIDRDRLGRAVKTRGLREGVRRLQYDALGRLHRVEEPNGLACAMRYDAEGNVLDIQDAHRSIRFEYDGRHWPVAQHDGGATLRFHYDTEGRRIAIENEIGERHRFTHDARGFIVEEHTFDGRTFRYERDVLGRLVRRFDPDESVTTFDHDAVGRVVRVGSPDGTETFSYAANGELIEAANDVASVRFERDALGRVVCESVGDAWVRSGYGAHGDRVRVTSSEGFEQSIERAALGSVRRVDVGHRHIHPWRVEFDRDPTGAELARHLPNGVSIEWARDTTGRPVRRRITAGGTTLSDRVLEWEGVGLRAIDDSRLGEARYRHDARGRLSWAEQLLCEPQTRATNARGDLHKSPRLDDRLFAPGGRLEQADGTAFSYDALGNVVERTYPDGRSMRYQWNAAGQLTEVELPSSERVRFTYDALGRRLSKEVLDPDGTVRRHVRWTWDGQVPLHELEEGQDGATWVWEPESFMLLGKMQSGRIWGVLPDHQGTPTELVDEVGALAWQMQLDAFGVPRQQRPPTDLPFRWAGQYEDEETGLFYNRFRYYDPETGQYLSADPLGIRGGLRPWGYVNDPFVQVDPFGLSPRRCPGGLGDELTSPALADPRVGIQSHLEAFRDGASIFMPASAYDRFVAGAPAVGRADGLFVMRADAADRLVAEAAGDREALKRALGIPAAYWNEPVVRLDVDNPLLHNARLPSGFEAGANELFRWGGYTSGGIQEAVLDPVPVGSYTLRGEVAR